MAVRMNVLVLRPPGNGSKAHQQFDDVIGQLLGRPGLDVTLLERLPGPNESTTERLALESLGGHIACLAWADAHTTVNDLAAAGKPMSRRPHRGDPEATSGNGKPADAGSGRMFFFDMRKPAANVSIFRDLQELLRTLQTPMFRIGSATRPTAADGRPPASALVPSESIDRKTIAPADPPSDAATKPTNRPEPASHEKNSDFPQRQSPTDEDLDDDLDRLVDQLDDLDL